MTMVSIQSDAGAMQLQFSLEYIFFSSFLFCCLFYNHSFQTNPNKITNCFKTFHSVYNFATTLLLRRFLDYLTSEEYEQGLQSLAEANARLRDQLIALQKETKEKDATSKEMNEAMNQTYATANQEIQNLQTGEYSKRKRACIAYMESTVVDIFTPPPSFQTCFIVFCHVSPSILKHPNKSFFNLIKYILTSFTTLYYLFL